MNVHRWTLRECEEQIRAGKLSPVELLETLSFRIDALEPRLHAWALLDREGARAEAQRCAAEAAAEKLRGPLHGIPIGIKDIFYTRGLRTGMGSPIFSDFVPDLDARSVAHLKRAGAIVLGKTVTTEFATFDPGPTRNPWNPAHTPGGSSSGSAAAVAARMCPAALGTQTVGSVGRPAAFCGIIGFVPGASRISRDGVFPASQSLDHVGIFARSTEDAALIYSVLSGEPSTASQQLLPLRLGLLRKFFYDRAGPEMREACDTAADSLSRAGANVQQVESPSILDDALSILMTIFQREVAQTHESLFRENSSRYGPKLRQLIEAGFDIPAANYTKAIASRGVYQAAMSRLFDRFDVLLSPGAPDVAPKGLESTGDPVMNAPWTLADFPTITLPVRLARSGLPLAIQLTAASGKESTLLAAGRWCEYVIAFREDPPERPTWD